MRSERGTVLAVAGPGERPDGCREAAQRHAERLDLVLTWRDVEVEGDLADLIRTAGDDHDALLLASGDLASSRCVAQAVRTASGPVVHVDTTVLDHLDVVHDACDHVIHGRQRRSFHDALAHIVALRASPPTTHAYGPGPEQVADLRLPATELPAPIVVLLHGGFWLDPYERDLMGPLAVALTDAGWATWNVEYRRLGPTGGGWPATLADACAAIDAVADLATEQPIDPTRVVLLGHSAGAQLVLYAATRADAPDDAPGVAPRVRPCGVVSLAGVLDLEAAAGAELGGGATTTLLGSPAEHPERYRAASPIHRLPVRTPLLVIHGPGDRLVPVDQSTSYVEAARHAGDDVEQHLPEVAHLDIIAPDGPAGELLTAWLERRGQPGSAPPHRPPR